MTDTDEDTVGLAVETLSVDKRAVLTGRVRIRTETEQVEEIAKVALKSEVVEVTRVAIDRVVERPPPIRTEGDVTIIPVLEEVAFVEKRLVLKEELHVRRKASTDEVEVPVTLRRQHAIVEHETLDPTPKATGDDADG
jgi:uncharacterized protein (TIGR02271 family)